MIFTMANYRVAIHSVTPFAILVVIHPGTQAPWDVNDNGGGGRNPHAHGSFVYPLEKELNSLKVLRSQLILLSIIASAVSQMAVLKTCGPEIDTR